MSQSPREIRTEVVINASPERVWSILTDVEKYPQWNPFIRSVKGTVSVGMKITVRMEPPGKSSMTFTPRLLVVDSAKELRWLGHLFVPGLFDGEHIFELYKNNDGSTIFAQREKFSGILVPFFKKMLDVNTRQGFEMMNKKLKELAEGQSAINSILNENDSQVEE